MARPTPLWRNPRRARRRPREGSSSLVLVFALGTVFALIALALNSASVSNHRVQLQAACEAAALAGAAELMDPGHLYIDPGHLYIDVEQHGSTSGDPASDHLSAAQRIAGARQRAIRFAAHNGVAGKPLLLAANETNDAGGDLVVGWVEDPTSLDSQWVPWTGTGPVNSLRVQAARSHLRGNPVTLWFGRILGVSDTDVVSSARATVDQRVYGFRPMGHVRVPLVPIVLLSLDGASVQTSQTSARTAPGRTDRFTVDPLSGDVRQGQDGIGEIELRVRLVAESSAESAAESAAQAGNASLLSFNGHGPDYALLREQIVQGLTAEDLETLGGELALDQDGRLRLSGIDLSNTGQLNKLGQMLLDVRGQKRIWPTGKRGSDWRNNAVCEIEGFMAGSVVDGYLETDACLTIVVQPCLLQTCTALVGTGKDRNPWIGKLVLDR
ncbi:MAG TPA: pilus assembly protein TadG-related protein [Thermoguttaceae bacterium]|nr:pilus assembly protein TadG-related protein [Thermoguttaceae bacterium]